MSQSSATSPLKRIIRRVARPFTGPIDGRVADINRRVSDVRASVESNGVAIEDGISEVALALASHAESVAAYAQSASEATTYTGIELRRIEETLQEGMERMRSIAEDQLYRGRLAHAIDSPLEKLDGALAYLLNHAAGHRGFAAQANLWFNQPTVVELSAGQARLTAVNERIVEVPFSMAALGRVRAPARILDIGSAESTFPLSAAALGYRVTALDLRPLPYSHPNLDSFAGRFEDWNPVPAEPFDAAFLISTIEHVGVGAYGEEAYGEGAAGRGADRAMLERLRKLLVPGGLLVLTTPYGESKLDGLERTYDDESLSALLEGWKIIERRIVVRSDALTWSPGEKPSPSERGVAMLIVSPKQPA